MTLGRTLLGSLLLLICLGCETEPNDTGATPLLDGSLTPDLLTEARPIEPPPSTSGNRFLSGWRASRSEESLRLEPTNAVARLEGVNLSHRDRSLVLLLTSDRPSLSGTVAARFAGGEQAIELPAEATVEIPLPIDLPLGRFPIDLEIVGEGRIGVEQASFSRALPAGEARVDGVDLIQSGNSLVDFVRSVEAETTLVGSFSPPTSPVDNQRFELIVELDDGSSEVAFSWQASTWWPFSSERKIELPLEHEGWIRVRVLATGEGPPARWKGLGLRGPELDLQPGAQSAAVEPPPPPRIVIVYVMDALRADYVGHLGGPAGITPTLDRLASEGATFVDHLSVAPNTAPSMKTMFTGQMFLLGGGWKLPADGPRTLAERFRLAGYNTGLLTGNGNLSAWRGLTRGFDYKPRRLHHERASRRSGKAYNDNAESLHDATIEWLDRLGPDERALVHIQTVHPHNPYDPPEPYRSRYTAGIDSRIDGETETLLSIKHQRISPTEADRERLIGLYAGSVAYNDAELERFLERILDRYPPEEVLVVFTSDHGEELFEHGGVLHGYTLYEEMLRVPLIFWWPGTVEPRRIEAATDSLDLHRTLVDLIDPAASSSIAGESLWPLALGEESHGKELRFAAASSVDGGIFMARSHRYKLIRAPRVGDRWGQGQGRGRGHDPEIVFDLENDPLERVNLAGEEILEAAWLRERLDAWVELGKRLEAGEPPEEMDEATRRSLEALGYL